MKWQAILPAVIAVLSPLVGCEAPATPETGEAVPSESRGHGESSAASVQSASTQPALIDLSADGVELRQAFNAVTGRVRVLLLVSPG